MKVKGRDIVACTSVVICGILIYKGYNGAIISFMATIIGWYFGRESKNKEEE